MTDDGAGFDSSATSYGSGLQGIADRLAALAGTLDVRSEPGAGTSSVVALPIGPAVPDVVFATLRAPEALGGATAGDRRGGS